MTGRTLREQFEAAGFKVDETTHQPHAPRSASVPRPDPIGLQVLRDDLSLQLTLAVLKDSDYEQKLLRNWLSLLDEEYPDEIS